MPGINIRKTCLEQDNNMLQEQVIANKGMAWIYSKHRTKVSYWPWAKRAQKIWWHPCKHSKFRGVISEDVDDKKQAIIRLKHKWLRLTPIGFILFWLLNTSLNIESQNFFVTMLNFKGIVGALVFTVLFFPIMYFYEKGNIHVIKDDNNE